MNETPNQIPVNKRRWTIIAVLSSAALFLAAGYYSTVRVDRAAAGHVLFDLASLSPMRVALVFGCSPQLADGRANPFFEGRMDAAARLLKSGRVSRLLVSGDNHSVVCDEPTWMRDALVARGVSPAAVVLDYAGFSTFDSLIRARDVFGLTEVTLVTQERHAKRAIFIAERLGIRTQAYAAQSIGGRFGLRGGARETLARIRALIDTSIFHRRPRFLGPRIEIGYRPNAPKSPSLT